MGEPRIIAEEADYLVVFKPRGMHAAPLALGEGGTLLAWCAGKFPEVLLPKGRKAVEGGLLHRLDTETEGLTVVARNQDFYDALALQQEDGFFLKEYRAICRDCRSDGGREQLLGFPTPPKVGSPPYAIESGFRPFGPGRRAVRPVIDPGAETVTEVGRRRRSREIALDRGRPYRTELLHLNPFDGTYVEIRIRLSRGFRHQVRCHLAWIGFPIRGDGLYGREGAAEGSLSLSAVAVSFLDPATSSPLRYDCSSSMDSESIS